MTTDNIQGSTFTHTMTDDHRHTGINVHTHNDRLRPIYRDQHPHTQWKDECEIDLIEREKKKWLTAPDRKAVDCLMMLLPSRILCMASWYLPQGTPVKTQLGANYPTG